MPKKRIAKPRVELTTDPEIIEQLKRQDDYGVVCEGFVDKDGNGWITKRSLDAWNRTKERDEDRVPRT